MLREPRSMYKVGRSNSLKKFKSFNDTEVKVIKSQYPHGFICEQYCVLLFTIYIIRINGKIIFVNIKVKDNVEEAKKIKEGAVITVKHNGTNVYGTLQYPQFYRERTDVKWENLIKS